MLKWYQGDLFPCIVTKVRLRRHPAVKVIYDITERLPGNDQLLKLELRKAITSDTLR